MSTISGSVQQKVNENLQVALKAKPIQWASAVAQLLTNKPPPSPSATRQALNRACLDPTVPQGILKNLIRYLVGVNDLTVEGRVKLIMSAIRCHNGNATRRLISSHCDPVHVLNWQEVTRSRNSLLHLACERYGWNDEIGMVLECTLETVGASQHLFRPNNKGKMPMELALEAGADFSEIVSYTHSYHREYLESWLYQLPPLVAQYCDDISVLERLLPEYPTLLDVGSPSPLYWACFYQNANMIRFLLERFVVKGERRKKLQTMLTTIHRQNDNDGDDLSPLGHLLMGLSSMDSNNALICLRVCLELVRNLYLLHHALDKLWDLLIREQKCVRLLQRLVLGFPNNQQIELAALDHGKSLLILVIGKLTAMDSAVLRTNPEPLAVLEYVLRQAPALVSRSDSKRGLPLHMACEQGMSWKGGLELIAKAHVSALQVAHPKSDLLPVALLASSCSNDDDNDDVESIYQLLRLNPGVI